MQNTERAHTPNKVPVSEVIDLANELAAQYEISSTRALIQSITSLSADNTLECSRFPVQILKIPLNESRSCH
jgi:hypothetical protein